MFTAYLKCATYQENLRESADNATDTTQNYSKNVDRDMRYEISRMKSTLDSILARLAYIEIQPKPGEQPRVLPLSHENQGATGGYQLPDQANPGARNKLTQVESQNRDQRSTGLDPFKVTAESPEFTEIQEDFTSLKSSVDKVQWSQNLR